MLVFPLQYSVSILVAQGQYVAQENHGSYWSSRKRKEVQSQANAAAFIPPHDCLNWLGQHLPGRIQISCKLSLIQLQLAVPCEDKKDSTHNEI